VLIEPETEGEVASILVTKLHGDGMPMLRYRVGDLGRFPAGACPGEPSLSLHEVVGREVSRLWLPDGRWMNGLAFPHMLKDFPVRDFQVRQASDFSVRVLVVPVDGFDASARDAVVRVVEANLPGVPVSLEVVESIARTKSNKWNPVVSEVRGGVPAGGRA
jgi:phenylacetate-CoA ligase